MNGQQVFEPGRWYAIGFANEVTGDIEWGPIYKYEGHGEWSDDADEPVESLYDPLLRMQVAMDAADAYQVQA